MWGLIPSWAKDDDIKKYTLNARKETLKTKPSFKNAKRCLIFADGFYEWKWLHYDYFLKQGVLDKPIVNVELFGGWTRKFMPQGVYSDEGKEVHYKEIEAAKKRPGLYIHLHSNPWFQGMAQDLPNRFELGGDGTIVNPGVRLYFDSIGGIRK